MATRYIVHSVEACLPFYTEVLGFKELENWGGVFAMVQRGDDVLWLSGPQTSAAKPMSDGSIPQPGGWNRLVVVVDNFEEVVEACRKAGAKFRNEPLSGPGGTQVLIEDPSGNPIELFTPRD